MGTRDQPATVWLAPSCGSEIDTIGVAPSAGDAGSADRPFRFDGPDWRVAIPAELQLDAAVCRRGDGLSSDAGHTSRRPGRVAKVVGGSDRLGGRLAVGAGGASEHLDISRPFGRGPPPAVRPGRILQLLRGRFSSLSGGLVLAGIHRQRRAIPGVFRQGRFFPAFALLQAGRNAASAA